MKYIISQAITLVFFLQPLYLFSQTDTSEIRKIEHLNNRFISEIKNPQGYINGQEYIKQYPNYKSGPFYGSENWMECTFISENESFTHKFIKYDIYDDVLVALIFTTAGPKYIELNKTAVSHFNLENKKFEFVKFQQPTSGDIANKYYEVLQSGNIKLYKSHQKKNIKPTDNSYGEFQEFYKYILCINNKAYNISAVDDLKKAASESNIDISKYINTNSFQQSKYFEQDLIQVIHNLNNN